MTLPILALAAALLAEPSPAAPARPSMVVAQAAMPAQLYGVLFEVDADDKGKAAKMVVAKVIDPKSGTMDAVQVDVPEAFLAAVKVELLKRDYPPGGHFFTYAFFDPARPDKGDINPREGRF